MSRTTLFSRSILSFALAFAASACASAAPIDDEDTEVAETESVDGEDAEIGEDESALCVAVDPTKSLLVTEAGALANFQLQTVLNAIIASAGVASPNALAFYRQWWDTNNDKAHAQTTGPHCDDQRDAANQPVINGFPVDCPRQEGALATSNPFAPAPNRDAYAPLALVNRFDLAPANGANCGQHRVVYGKVSGQSDPRDRNLIIFEPVIPNPSPALGIKGCQPIAQFWANLTAASPAQRTTELQKFYFQGFTDPVSKVFVPPVLRAANFVGSESGSGQIRTNQFMNNRPYFGPQVPAQPWQLREYRLSLAASCAQPGGCPPTVVISPVKNNPSGPLFSANGGPLAAQFQSNFVNSQVQTLVSNNVNGIAMNIPVQFDGAQSTSQGSANNYAAQAQNNPAFLSSIQSKLASLGRGDLSPQQLLDRATTQSCAGCHQLSNNRPLGGGAVWPVSNAFTHISEAKIVSPALNNVFLPNRKKALEAFLCSP